MMKEVNHRMLKKKTSRLCNSWMCVAIELALSYQNKHPGSDLCQNRVLSIKAVVVGIKGVVIQEKEAQPVALADAGVAADGVVLVSHPHRQNDVERCGGVVEKLRHNGFHPCNKDTLHNQ